MKIYVASSWKNTLQPSVVAALRAADHDVYDFRNPGPSDTGFKWKQILQEECCNSDCRGEWGTGCDHCHFYTCPCLAPLKDPRRFRDKVLTSPVAQAAFAKDMGALRAANVTVLVLPCGRSAHLELGWAAGANQKTVVLLDDPLSEPELMYLMNTKICVNMDEVLEALAAWTIQRPRWCKDHIHTGHCQKCGEYAQTGDASHHVATMLCSCGNAMVVTCPPGCVGKRSIQP